MLVRRLSTITKVLRSRGEVLQAPPRLLLSPPHQFYSSSQIRDDGRPSENFKKNSPFDLKRSSGDQISLSKQRKTTNERDAEHLEKMKEAMGGSDLSNVEIEDGVPDRGMKRHVRENLFRII